MHRETLHFKNDDLPHTLADSSRGVPGGANLFFIRGLRQRIARPAADGRMSDEQARKLLTPHETTAREAHDQGLPDTHDCGYPPSDHAPVSSAPRLSHQRLPAVTALPGPLVGRWGTPAIRLPGTEAVVSPTVL